MSFEFRYKVNTPGWRKTWDWANFIGSLVPAVVFSVAFTDLVHGLPLGPDGRYYGGILGLLHPIALVGGLAGLAVFCMHGSLFLSLKTSGELSLRARRAARLLVLPAFVLLGTTVTWVAVAGRPPVAGSLPSAVPLVLAVVALGALVIAGLCVGARREGLGFAATGCTILLGIGAVFARMFPAVLPSSGISVQQPHHRRGIGGSLDAARDDGRGRDLHACRPRIPGLDVLGLPAAVDPPSTCRRRRPGPRLISEDHL